MATFSRRAEIRWDGDVVHGSGTAGATSGAFAVPVTFPSTTGEAPGKTTSEELLVASHATCFGIGLRSVIGRRGGSARRITVSATITAEKGPAGIRIQASHLEGVIEGLEKIDDAHLPEIVHEVAEGCTISIAIRDAVRITHAIRAVEEDWVTCSCSSNLARKIARRARLWRVFPSSDRSTRCADAEGAETRRKARSAAKSSLNALECHNHPSRLVVLRS